MPELKDLRGDLQYSAAIPPTAAGTAIEVPVVKLPFDALITEVLWIPGAAMTANGTNFCTLNFRNRQSAAGTIVPAGPRSWASGNSVSTTPETLTLSSTATDLQAASGDLLTAHFTHTASGLAIPAGLVQVKVRRR
ncbi:MAG: hypothetical protein ACJ72N_06895 [Labedaea sp.]